MVYKQSQSNREENSRQKQNTNEHHCFSHQSHSSSGVKRKGKGSWRKNEKVASDIRLFNCFNEPEYCYVSAESAWGVEIEISHTWKDLKIQDDCLKHFTSGKITQILGGKRWTG